MQLIVKNMILVKDICKTVPQQSVPKSVTDRSINIEKYVFVKDICKKVPQQSVSR